MGVNYYSILNLKRHCTKDDIHKAYASYLSLNFQSISLILYGMVVDLAN